MLKLVDLYCGSGELSVGYARAGFSVTGVDRQKSPCHEYDFVQKDDPLLALMNGELGQFDVVSVRTHGSGLDVNALKRTLSGLARLWVVAMPETRRSDGVTLVGHVRGVGMAVATFESNILLFGIAQMGRTKGPVFSIPKSDLVGGDAKDLFPPVFSEFVGRQIMTAGVARW